MTPYYDDGQMAVYCDRAETVLPTLPAQSVDLILTDPPYFRVKAEDWDRQWPNAEAYLAWLSGLFTEWRRVLKPNGSVYLFCGPDLAARTECLLGEAFHVLNNIRWVKEEGWHKKTDEEALRSFLSPWEAVLFAEQRVAASNPVGASVQHHRSAAGLTCDALERALGYLDNRGRGSRLAYRWECGNSLPTAADYVRALQACGDQRAYEALQREYEALRRPFTAREGVFSTDTWRFPTVAPYPGKHPCEKPLALLEYAIEASTRPGAVVLDCCAGSGSTLRAAKNVGRQAIGIEPDARWCRQIIGRLAQECLPWEATA